MMYNKAQSPSAEVRKQSKKNRRNQWAGVRGIRPTDRSHPSNGFLLFQRSSSSHRIWQTGATFRASVVTLTSHWVCVFEDSTLEGATSVGPKPAARRHRQAGLHRDYEGTTAATRWKRLAVQLQRVIKIQHNTNVSCQSISFGGVIVC